MTAEVVIHFIPTLVHTLKDMPKLSLSQIKLTIDCPIAAKPNQESLGFLILDGIVCVSIERQIPSCFAINYWLLTHC